jgi:hypothetical protein
MIDAAGLTLEINTFFSSVLTVLKEKGQRYLPVFDHKKKRKSFVSNGNVIKRCKDKGTGTTFGTAATATDKRVVVMSFGF